MPAADSPSIEALLPLVDSARLQAELDELATFSSTPAPGVTRVLFTPVDLQARDYVRALMRDAGLLIVEDPAGNIFGRWLGSDDLAAEAAGGRVGTGSHCDAIPHAGKYDGTVGVLGGIAAVRALKAAGFVPKHSIDVVMFTSEEPTRFGIGCAGSRLMGGALDPCDLAGLVDDEGITFEAARLGAGYVGALSNVVLDSADYANFVELHVEQGPELERQALDIGVVSAIAAPASFKVHLSGPGGHAGTVLMPDRADPLGAAAQLIALTEKIARNSGSPDSVATVGMVDVHPGAINSIPRSVSLSFDVRDTDLEVREAMVSEIVLGAERLARSRSVEWQLEPINADPPAICAPAIVAAIEQRCEAEGFGYTGLVSRAYHDALFVSRKCPVGMVFVPSRDGISHRPDEFTSESEIARGVAVLAGVLRQLAAA